MLPDETPTHFQLILFKQMPHRHPFFLLELLLKKREKGGAGMGDREAGRHAGSRARWEPEAM